MLKRLRYAWPLEQITKTIAAAQSGSFRASIERFCEEFAFEKAGQLSRTQPVKAGSSCEWSGVEGGAPRRREAGLRRLRGWAEGVAQSASTSADRAPLE